MQPVPSRCGYGPVLAGTKFDSDTSTHVSLTVDAKLGADKIKVTDDTKAHSTLLKFGDTVTYTLQVIDSAGNAVAESGVEVRVTATIEDTTTTPDRPDRSVTSSVMKTDASGKIEVSYSQSDPTATIRPPARIWVIRSHLRLL